MTHYYRLGTLPHKRHTQFRQANGTLYHEELIGIHGFSGIQSLLYHVHPPTQMQTVGVVSQVDRPEATDQTVGALRPRHFRTGEMPVGEDAIAARMPLLINANLCISVARPTRSMDYWYRLAQGDEIIFIHEGRGDLESQYGVLHYHPGDYLVIPTGVLWRILPDESMAQRMLAIESTGHVIPPTRYRNQEGQFLETSPYCERDIRPPDRLITHDQVGEFEVRVKARGCITRYLYPHHPLDVIGWDGHLYPYAFNIADFEPITGRIHQPPPIHQTFEAPGFVVCSFVPRLFDYHALAIPAPYNHSNVDSDEVIYYVAGDFMSRNGIESASVTVHPGGIPHGPHPGRYEGSIGKTRTEELAIMIDTFSPLTVTQAAVSLEDIKYADSWIHPASFVAQ